MSHLQHKSQVVHNVIRGLYLGYPSCCIVDFHVRQLDGRITSGEHRTSLFSGTGYVCCPECDNKGIIQLHCEIANSRFASTTFPIDPPEDEVNSAHLIMPRNLITSVANAAITICEQFMEFE